MNVDNRQKKLVFLGVLLLGCWGTSWLAQGRDAGHAVQTPLISRQLASGGKKEERSRRIQVYVSGAVCEPGVYELPVGARLTEALEAAGGMTEKANAERVNLAKKLRDGAHVYVPERRDRAVKHAQSGAAGAAAGEKQSAAGSFKAGAAAKERPINLNTASAEELVALPGIGPAMANRILALRRTRRFSRVEDLLQVRGIGQAKLERLRPYITVE